MSKYVIKNCENYDPFLQEPTCNKYPCDCQTKTDCLLKRIVEECNNAKMRASDYYRNPYSGGVYDEANRILDSLDIEECE